MTATAKLLVVDDEKIALNNLVHVLQKEGYAVTGAQSGPDAIKLLEKEHFDLVLTDLKMARVDGFGVMERSKELQPETEVIIITGFASIDSAIETMKKGAYHYIAKPYKLDEVRKVVGEALEKMSLRRENRQLKEQLKTFRGDASIITNNQKMKKLLEMAKQVAETGSTIIIYRGVGHRQGAAGPLHSRQQPAQRRGHALHQLRGLQRRIAGQRTLRPRKGGLYRGRRAEEGAGGDGQRRHPLSR